MTQRGKAQGPSGAPKRKGPPSRSRKAGSSARSGPARSGSGRAGSSRSSGSSGSAGQKRRKAPGLGGEQVEGRHAVREALIAGRRKVREILMSADMDQADIIDDIVEIARAERVTIREVSRRRLDSESHTMASQGVIAYAAPLEPYSLESLCVDGPDGTPPFLLVLDGITDPGNLGALIRSADGAGVSGIVLPKHRAVHVTATVAKAAAGAIEYVPMALVGGLPTALRELTSRGIWSVGLDSYSENELHGVSLGGRAVAMVLGSEDKGLSRLVKDRCDEVVSIPMSGHMESLNVSNAGALAMYEVVRARR